MELLRIRMEYRMIVYTSDTCAKCRTLKYLLDKWGVDYELRNISNPEYQKEADSYGRQLPITVVGKDFVVGANFSAIKAMIQ